MATSEKHLLVDGQNVIHAWPDLAKLARTDIGAARESLRQRLTALTDTEGVQVTLVFDGRSKTSRIEETAGSTLITVIHTAASNTADDVIEHLVAKAPDPKVCIVATSDRMERQTVEALGAATLSPADLATWLLRTAANLSRKLGQLRKDNDKR